MKNNKNNIQSINTEFNSNNNNNDNQKNDNNLTHIRYDCNLETLPSFITYAVKNDLIIPSVKFPWMNAGNSKWKTESVPLLEEYLKKDYTGKNISNFDQFLTKTYKKTHKSGIDWFSKRGLPDKVFSKDFQEDFGKKVIPFMFKTALEAPNILKTNLPILFENVPAKLIQSKRQVFTILICAFLGLFENYDLIGDMGSHFPRLEFDFILTVPNGKQLMYCLINYFSRCQKEELKGYLIIERKVLLDKDKPDWKNSQKKISKNVEIVHDIGIENSDGIMHADFANEYIGGGVMHASMVQEEILFIIKPECIVTLLFCQKMNDIESISIIGAEQFSAYSGYNSTFTFAGDFLDKTKRDEKGTIITEIIAYDATVNFFGAQQFTTLFYRDLHKAYCAFFSPHQKNKDLPKLSTGNWGCGAFGGDKGLKFFQQLIASSQAQREMFYSTFKEKNTCEMIKSFYSLILKKDLTVGDLIRLYEKSVKNWKSRECSFLEMIAKGMKD